jgi:hypothetical protein
MCRYGWFTAPSTFAVRRNIGVLIGHARVSDILPCIVNFRDMKQSTL